MKIRYQNGFSISLWSNEFKQIEVTEEVIQYQTQDGQWIIIKVPSQWSQNSSSSSSEPLSHPANELARESNNSARVFSVSSPPDVTEAMQRQIDGLQRTLDAKIAELAREVRSIPEVNLKEFEMKILDRVEAIRKDHLPPANELAKESDNSAGGFPISPPSDMMEAMQRRIDGLQMTWDAKIAELAREAGSIPEINLKELEMRILDRIEAIRKDHWMYLETDCQNINTLEKEVLQFEDDFKEIDQKLNNLHEVINIIINHDCTLRDKMTKILEPIPESDKEIKKRC